MAVSMYFRDKDGNTIDVPVLRGPAGGHYTPVVSQPDSETMQVDFVASHAGMPAVEPAQVKLPGAGSGQNPTIAMVEPAEDDIPKVFFGGPLQQTKDEAVVPFRYISKTQDIPGYAEIKAQGNSSMSYPKKNQTVKLYKDADCSEKLKVDFKGWGKQNKFCFKANWIDLSHARNVVSSRLWGDVVMSRANYAELPELLRTSPNQGAVDGFPVKVYAAGIYQGRYTLNIPKDKWMVNMDDELDTHCILCGEGYVSGCFRAASVAQWTDEIHDTMPNSIKTRWIEVINFVMNSTDEEFEANLGDYFDVQSLIDYHLFGLASCGLDAYGKNQLYMTYDGQKWIASMYDMDSTWGLYWNGGKFVASDYARTSYEDYVSSMSSGEGNLLYIRLEHCFYEELQARWPELKAGPLRIENIINRFERFTDIAPAELVKEDFASTTGGGNFTSIPSQTTNNIQQIRAFALARQAWVDTYVAGLVKIPATGISLNVSTLTFDTVESKTLIATLEPENSTDAVVWSSSKPDIATVDGGVVTPVASGSTVITATAGDVSATCEVIVDVEVPTYTITNNLTNATNSNSAESISEGASYSTMISAESGYILKSVTVSMGGEDITSTAVSGGAISIASVTGDIVITAVGATIDVGYGDMYTLAEAITSNGSDGTGVNTGVKPNSGAPDITVIVDFQLAEAAVYDKTILDATGHKTKGVCLAYGNTELILSMQFGYGTGILNSDLTRHKVAVSFNRSGGIVKIYVDGALVRTVNNANETAWLEDNENELCLLGGYEANIGTRWCPNGTIYHCDVYNGVLTDEQVIAKMASYE